MEIIKSFQNEKIKKILKLKDKKYREKYSCFIVEGLNEISRALSFGGSLNSFIVCESFLTQDSKELLSSQTKKVENIYVEDHIFEKLAMRGQSFGVLAVFDHYKKPYLKNIDKPSFVLIVEGIEKPGNIGALLRTAVAAGIDLVISVDSSLDIENPHVIRSSLGTCFEVPIISLSKEKAFDFCKNNNIEIYAAWVNEISKPFDKISFKTQKALLLGAEHSGLDPFWKDKATPVFIPMSGSIDSLNVSVSGAILMYRMK